MQANDVITSKKNGEKKVGKAGGGRSQKGGRWKKQKGGGGRGGGGIGQAGWYEADYNQGKVICLGSVDTGETFHLAAYLTL